MARPALNWLQSILRLQKRPNSKSESCEHCHSADAEIPFDWRLAEVTGRRGAVEFVLTEPARCPNCKHETAEKTLVEPAFRERVAQRRFPNLKSAVSHHLEQRFATSPALAIAVAVAYFRWRLRIVEC
jgi:hypothetical protein